MNLTEIKNHLSRLDLHPSKALGQNFLHDQNLARWIVEKLELSGNELVVEIGPGLGALTDFLRERVESLTLLEKDSRLAAHLQERFPGPSVEVMPGDAMDFPLKTLWGRGAVAIVGNLPYYVSGPLLAYFSQPLNPAEKMIFMVQKEVAERLCAKPGSKDYGALTVVISRDWNVEYLKTVRGGVFLPVPKVDSAIVRLSRKPGDTIPKCDERAFRSLVRLGFSERRKQLRKLLGENKTQWEQIAPRLGLDVAARAEALGLQHWEALTQVVQSLPNSGEEFFDVVDENDCPIGAQPRSVVHAQNLRHRAVHIWVFNQAGELFLQKRQAWKDNNPGVWDSSCAGHVGAGESYEESALREMQEELGVRPSHLQECVRLNASYATGEEFIQVYQTLENGPFQLDALEIRCGAFFPLSQIARWIKSYPEQFSPVFHLIWKQLNPGGQPH